VLADRFVAEEFKMCHKARWQAGFMLFTATEIWILSIHDSLISRNSSSALRVLGGLRNIVNPKEPPWDAGLTQAEVSARMRRARTFISKCELGDRRVDFVELARLARIYRKNLSFFEVE